MAARRGRIFGTDQVALALSVHEDKIPTEFLPAYCNWMCEFHLPIYDSQNNQFLEPYLPNHPLALVHLAGLDEITRKKVIKMILKECKGKTVLVITHDKEIIPYMDKVHKLTK